MLFFNIVIVINNIFKFQRLPYKEPDQYEIDQIYNQLSDKYALDPERYIEEQNYKVQGDLNCNRMTDLLKETEELLQATKSGIYDYEIKMEKEEIEIEKENV